MAYGVEHGFQNAGAPTVQPETEEERQRRLAQTQNFTQPQVQGPPVTGVHGVNGQWNNGGQGFNQGVNADVARYRDMANRDLGPGAQIDQTQANQARGIQDGGIGMLQRRAQGGATPAQFLMGQQTRGAVDAVRSGAASIRGGAAARAAAGQQAGAIGARVQAQGEQDRSALRAREIADASGQLMGASTDRRGQDLGVATDQAKLEQQQRALAAQAKNNYEGLGYDVKNAALGQQLGRTAADQNAANTDRQQSLTESKASWGVVKDVGGAAIGGVSGGVQAYDKSQQQSKPNPYDYAGSDVRMKTSAKPVGSPKERLRARAEDRSGTEYEDGYDNSMFRKNDDGPPKSLTDAIDSAQAKGGDIERKNPYGDGPTGGPGYARSRAGKPGGMFFGKSESVGHDMSAQEDPFAKAKRYNNAKDQAISMSDVRSKEDIMSPKERLRARVENQPPQWLRDEMREPDIDLDKAEPPEWLTEHMKPADEEMDKAPPPEWLRDHMEGREPNLPERYAGEIKDTSLRDPESTERPIRPADQNAIDAMTSREAAYRTMLGKSSVDRAAHRDSPLEEDRGDRYAREIGGDNRTSMTSDPRAKQEAFLEGQRHVVQGKSFDEMPDYAKPKAPKAEAPKTEARLGLPKARDDSARTTAAAGLLSAAPAILNPALGAANMGVAAGRTLATSMGMVKKNDASIREGTPSDPRAKTSMHESPMASANRSMEPSSYEYKPEFTPPEQKPGEVNVGPMANKMKANPIARTAIVEDEKPPHMLAIDVKKGLKLTMGGLADLQRQVDRLERRRA